jgi:hypothetical protein
MYTKRAINCFCTVRPNQKGMFTDFRRKLKLKLGNIKTRVKGDFTPMVWKDKRNVNMFTNMPAGEQKVMSVMGMELH